VTWLEVRLTTSLPVPALTSRFSPPKVLFANVNLSASARSSSASPALRSGQQIPGLCALRRPTAPDLVPQLGEEEAIRGAGARVYTWESRPSGDIRRERPAPSPLQPETPKTVEAEGRTVTAKRPNHVWHVDLTTAPTQLGFGARGRPLHGPNAGPGAGGWHSFWITFPMVAIRQSRWYHTRQDFRSF